MPKFEFVNHSSVILSHDNVSLAMDPWIEGLVFNNSWNLLTKTPQKSINNLKKSKFVWFSHEHPDHFNPSNLKIFSKDTNFLFQKTIDGRVVKFLKKISPNVKEIKLGEKYKLSKNFLVEIIPFQYLDFMLISRINNLTILNLNDCDIKNKFQLEFIKKKTGSIDILLVQFSYAIGKSNRESINERKKWAHDILVRLSKNIKFLNPKIVIPFASFCYFSRYDNFYLNDFINKIDNAINFLSKENSKIKFLAFYPGDTWDFYSDFSNINTFKKYKKDYENMKIVHVDEQKLNFKLLKQSSDEFIKLTKSNNNFFNLYYFFLRNNYKIYFKITDTNKIYFFSFKTGLIEVKFFDDRNDKAWCSMTSQTLNNLFKSGYGYDALIIGGRFEANEKGLLSLNYIFKFQAKNYQNIYYNFNSIIKNIFYKIFKRQKIYHKR